MYLLFLQPAELISSLSTFSNASFLSGLCAFDTIHRITVEILLPYWASLVILFQLTDKINLLTLAKTHLLTGDSL